MEEYEFVKDLCHGVSGYAKLMKNKRTRELVAIKCIPRGNKIDINILREIENHQSLCHRNIIQFHKVFLTPIHLAIVMEYAAGGDLFNKVSKSGRFSEDEARYFFQQLISGISHCHSKQICHRDLKLENLLLMDGSNRSCLKICDFGFSKSYWRHSRPHSKVGTTHYMAPKVFCNKPYNGKLADVWSCGAVLYVMLVDAYPFSDPTDPTNVAEMVKRIESVQYHIPDHVRISEGCKDLLARIFTKNPVERITLQEIQKHKWFTTNLSWSTQARDQGNDNVKLPSQSFDEIKRLVEAARKAPPT